MRIFQGGRVSVLLCALLLSTQGSFPGSSHAQAKSHPPGNRDVRLDGPMSVNSVRGVNATATSLEARTARAAQWARGIARLEETAPGVVVSVSPITGSAEVVSAAAALTAAAPGRSGESIVREFVQANAALYGLANEDIANLHFIGESISQASGLRMVRVEQLVNGRPVFQSESRFILDREGRLVRSVGLLVPDAAATAAALVATVSAQDALVAAMASVNLTLDPARMTLATGNADGSTTEVAADDPQISGRVRSELVYFPIAPGVLVPAWSQVTMTRGEGDWYTLVDANTGALLWRKNIRSHASTQEARFSVYVQADGTTPADNPAPLSPTTATPGSNTQPAGIARTTVNMLTVQNITASPNGWIADGTTSTTGNNVDAYLDRNNNNIADPGTLDNNGRPTGNLDTASRNRDFLGTNYVYTPPPTSGNPESGTAVTDLQLQRGIVTHLFYLTNWYHDRLVALGFDEAAGNFQTVNFSGMGSGNDAVLAEAQDAAALTSGRNNANFSTPADGGAGRMQMYIFDGPTVDRDGSLDAEIVIHELSHGLSNRIVGNASGLQWDVGGGLGEGWSDFYALSLLNNTNADNPDARYASGAYATYKLAGLTDNYLYGIRRFPYCTDNTVNPLTWADVDDVTYSSAGGIATSPLNFGGNGAGEVHNSGEIWALTLWEVRSRVIADPAGANGDVPTGNNMMLQIVTDGMKMTPLNPSFIDARDALIAADNAANSGANEQWIWQGFADRGLGYKAVAPFSRMFGYRAGHVGIGESFDVPYLDVQSVAVDDSSGNNNGAIDPGENVKITVKLKNPWRRVSFGVAAATATLSTATAGITITYGSATYPAIAALGSADGTKFHFNVPVSATAGQALNFTITSTSTLGTKAVDFTLRVGTPSGNGAPVTFTRTIAGGLAIPDNAPRGVVSILTVTEDYEIADLNFRIDNLTHTWAGDVTAMLRAPNGLGTDLISAVGGLAADGGSGDNFVNIVIDDQATGDLLTAVAAAAPFTGSWKPMFNAASWAVIGTPDPVGLLSRYNGLSTKGDWKVLVSDQASLDTGILNAWSLIVTPKAYLASLVTSPTITTISPASGSTAGGTSVTITGTYLTGTSAVSFGGTAATAVAVVNATTVTCTTAARAASLVDVVLTTPSGSATRVDGYTYVPPPAVTSATSSTANGQYKVGGAINVTVNFSQLVATPGLTINLNSGGSLNTGSLSGVSSYSGTYTVAAGQTAADLSISSIVGTITNPGGVATVNPTVPAGLNIADAKAIVIDTTAPTLGIGSPSATLAHTGPVTYAVTYADTNFNASTLALGDVTLNKTGSANGTVGVSGSGSTRTVTISSITGHGTLGITLAAGTATDLAGNSAAAAGPSATFLVYEDFVPGMGGLKVLAAAVDQEGWTFTTTAGASWGSQMAVTHDGIDAARSAFIADNQASAFATTGVFGAGSVSFWWKVSSEPGTDFLRFFIDGALVGAIAGEVDWEQKSFPVSAGIHTLTWEYAKNGSGSGGLDAAWVDEAALPAAPVWANRAGREAVLAMTAAILPDAFGGDTWTALTSPTREGAPWEATSWTRPDPADNYVLWTRGDTGQAILEKYAADELPGAVAQASWAYLRTTVGVGSPWQATSYAHVDAATGYLLWTRGDTGQALLWKVVPGAVSGMIPVASAAYLNTSAGVGGPWQATSYTHVDAREGYVLWTRADTGEAILWEVAPGAVSGTIPVIRWAHVNVATGAAGPWIDTSYVDESLPGTTPGGVDANRLDDVQTEAQPGAPLQAVSEDR